MNVRLIVLNGLWNKTEAGGYPVVLAPTGSTSQGCLWDMAPVWWAEQP